MVIILLLSRELLVDVLGVIDVVRQGSVLRVLDYDKLAKVKDLLILRWFLSTYSDL